MPIRLSSLSSSAPTYFPVSAAGTYTISQLEAGVYLITTESSQTFTFSFQTTSGFKFSTTIRGGQGYISVPVPVTQLVIPESITYSGLIIGYSKINYTQISAPTSLSFAWNGVSGNNNKGDLTFTSDVLANNTKIYWSDGSSISLSTTSSPKTNIVPYPLVLSAGQTRTFLVVSQDANAVDGLASSVTTPNSPSNSFASTFNSSGSWTAPTGVTSVEALVVAGGGGSGGMNAPGGSGGGGAGGLRYSSSLAVTPGNTYTVTVGAGGTKGLPSQASTSGTNSSFTTLTANGGGGGGGTSGTSGQSGGCGGGANYNSSSAGSGNQGFNGGTGNSSGSYLMGGGGGGMGGAGNNGVNAATSTNGMGGNGLSYNISGSSVWYSVGGAGGGSGYDFGGKANPNGGYGNYDANLAAPANRGLGANGTYGYSGFGSTFTNNGSTGGSGVVIIKYTA